MEQSKSSNIINEIETYHLYLSNARMLKPVEKKELAESLNLEGICYSCDAKGFDKIEDGCEFCKGLV